MRTHSLELTHWQQDRRALIEHRVFWRGWIRLADLMTVMGVSRAQASKDINSYINNHPKHIEYNKTTKCYEMGSRFRAHYTSLDASKYLEDLLSTSRGLSVPSANWIVYQPDILATSVPSRRLKAIVVRNILLACEQKKIVSIEYQSMSSPNPNERLIAPHAVGYDGFRWHTRAYCFKDHNFKDFVLARILKSELRERSGIDFASDKDWHQTVNLQISPHPDLSDSQKRIVELDYAMANGVAQIEVRKSLLYYNLKHLGLDVDPMTRSPQDQQIILKNSDEIYNVLNRKPP
ncbi:MAG: WYL domain-containing protein [Aestuariivita sp.]|nr:WYL domain-containing protein [Aestuariivita sp.]